jgi:hypothetical protein
LFEPGGVLVRAGINLSFISSIIHGSVGVIIVDGMKGVPFGFLAISAALPSLVMAAGYILVYSLPVMHSIGIAAYGTTALPVLSRYIVWVWLYRFAGTLFELRSARDRGHTRSVPAADATRLAPGRGDAMTALLNSQLALSPSLSDGTRDVSTES